MTKKCIECKKTKNFDAFDWRNKARGTKQSWCRKCKKEYDKSRYRTKEYRTKKSEFQRIRRAKNRQIIVEFLSDKSCVDCRESRIPALQFDHIKDKKGCISNMLDRSLESIQLEIKKCEIRCANCHAVKTAKEQGWYSNGETA